MVSRAAVRGFIASIVLTLAPVLPSSADAAPVVVTGGQSTITLDAEVLASGGLTLVGTGPFIMQIAPRDANEFPTTFAYDTEDFDATASGKIDHFGQIQVSPSDPEVFVPIESVTIFRDRSREGSLGGKASGYFVQNNPVVGPVIDLFDLATFDTLSAGETALTIEADLLIAPEFAAFLLENGLTTTDLSGADAGEIRVDAEASVIPLPPAAGAAALTFVALGFKRAARIKRLSNQ